MMISPPTVEESSRARVTDRTLSAATRCRRDFVDDKFLVDLYSVKFTREGYNVQACVSAAHALHVLRTGFVPDVILFDVVMPQQDGFAFLQALLDEHLAPNSSLIALTNQATDDDKKKAAQLGASRYIVKADMLPADVVATVVQALNKDAPLLQHLESPIELENQVSRRSVQGGAFLP
jgi:CheY-like chemotaxis protein